MSYRERFFYYSFIAIAFFALWRSTQGPSPVEDIEPQFKPKNETEKQAYIDLEFIYGKFTSPKVPNNSKLVNSELQLGRRVYAIQCMHCHGPDGQAKTPTARLLNPKPRNLSSGEAHNVEFTLKNGIPSTAMSSFNHLSEQEFNAVRDYALYLEERAKKWGSLLGGESE